jgi:hypothetical protein
MNEAIIVGAWRAGSPAATLLASRASNVPISPAA